MFKIVLGLESLKDCHLKNNDRKDLQLSPLPGFKLKSANTERWHVTN
jgi:hypothetical protein